MSTREVNTIGQLVKTLRMRHGLSQQQLADAVGVSKTSVFLYENGQNLPKPDTSKRLAEYFGLPIEEFQASESESTSKTDLAQLARLAGVTEDALLDRLLLKHGLQVAAELAEEAGIMTIRMKTLPDGSPAPERSPKDGPLIKRPAWAQKAKQDLKPDNATDVKPDSVQAAASKGAQIAAKQIQK